MDPPEGELHGLLEGDGGRVAVLVVVGDGALTGRTRPPDGSKGLAG